MGTKSCDVYIYDRAKDQVNRFLLDSDSTGVFNDQGVFERYGYDKAKKNTISSNRVFSLTGDGRGHLF